MVAVFIIAFNACSNTTDVGKGNENKLDTNSVNEVLLDISSSSCFFYQNNNKYYLLNKKKDDVFLYELNTGTQYLKLIKKFLGVLDSSNKIYFDWTDYNVLENQKKGERDKGFGLIPYAFVSAKDKYNGGDKMIQVFDSYEDFKQFFSSKYLIIDSIKFKSILAEITKDIIVNLPEQQHLVDKFYSKNSLNIEQSIFLSKNQLSVDLSDYIVSTHGEIKPIRASVEIEKNGLFKVNKIYSAKDDLKLLNLLRPILDTVKLKPYSILGENVNVKTNVMIFIK